MRRASCGGKPWRCRSQVGRGVLPEANASLVAACSAASCARARGPLPDRRRPANARRWPPRRHPGSLRVHARSRRWWSLTTGDQKGNYRLANAIMGGLDDLTSVAQSCNQREAPVALKRGHDLVDTALCARHAGDHRQGEWTSASSQDLDELTCLLEARRSQTLADHLLERQYCECGAACGGLPRFFGTSSSGKKGLPRDSRAIARAVR